MTETPEFGSLREKIAWETQQRKARYADYARIVTDARAAGTEAGETAIPRPMVVQERTSPFDDTSPVRQEWLIEEGVCGFAWVSLRKGNTSFAVWAKKNAGFQHSSYMGTYLWVGAFGQSYERKMAYARAYAKVLSDNGIEARASGRLD